MAQNYGLTPQGFRAKQLQTIKGEIEASLRSALGQNLNFLPNAVFGQIVGIFSEREALVWQVGEAVYASQYPSGAEGTSVDNVLALTNLRRLGALATKTSATENNVPGLVLYGAAGTLITSGSLISILDQPTSQFSIDSDVTIAAALNAVQAIVFTSPPTAGTFTLTIVRANGDGLTTAPIPYNATGHQNLKQTLSFSAVPTSGSFKIKIGALSTALIPFSGNAATVQSAVQALAGYSTATVTGTYSSNFVIVLPDTTQPIIEITNNTLDNAGTVVVTVTPLASLEASIQAIFDAGEGDYPFTDAIVSGSFITGFTVFFGIGTVQAGQPVSSAQAQANFIPTNNSLMNGLTVVNIKVTTTVIGAPAQAIASATALTTGPIFCPAGTLTVIDTPVAGWTSVNNPLDAVTGRNIEEDTEALERRTLLLAANANGPTEAIVEDVLQVPFVSAALGFENNFSAALQKVQFSAEPDAGSFKLVIAGEITASLPYTSEASDVQDAVQLLDGFEDALVSGDFLFGFSIDFNGSFGGQPQPLIAIMDNTLERLSNPITTTESFGRPGHNFEIVVEGGSDNAIAQAIFDGKPSGITSYGNTTVLVTDRFNTTKPIKFSRPYIVPFYVVINLNVDPKKFPANGAQIIQQDLVTLGVAIPIGGLVIGYGSNGLIGAFNNVPGITSYTMYFGRSPNPVTQTNVQLLSEQKAQFETFNIIINF